MKRLSILSALALALAGLAGAQDLALSRQGFLTITTVAGLPASDINGRIYAVTDGTPGDLCGTGGGAVATLCIYDTTEVAWVPYGGATLEINGLEVDGVDGIAADELIVGTAADTVAYVLVPDCDNPTTSKLLYDVTTHAFTCGTDQTGGGSGDAVTVKGSAVDTTADLDDTATVEWTLVDGGAGGPDQARASVVADSIGPTQIDETATYDFSAGGMTLPSGTAFGSGTTPFNLTGFTDDVAPSAPGTANQFTAYVLRSSSRVCSIVNGGSAACYLASVDLDTFAELDALVADKALTNLVDAQTFATGTKTVTAKFDFGGGTLEAPNSNTLPGTCVVGEVYFDADATAGSNWYGCTATDTWTLQGGGGSSTSYHWSACMAGNIRQGGTSLDGGCSFPDTAGNRPGVVGSPGSDWGSLYTTLDNTDSDFDYIITPMQFLPSTFTGNMQVAFFGSTDGSAATTGNIQIRYEWGCVVHGQTNRYPASSTSGYLQIVAPNSENNDALIASTGAVDISTLCDPGDILILRVGRDTSDAVATDSYEDNVFMTGIQWAIEY